MLLTRGAYQLGLRAVNVRPLLEEIVGGLERVEKDEAPSEHVEMDDGSFERA